MMDVHMPDSSNILNEMICRPEEKSRSVNVHDAMDDIRRMVELGAIPWMIRYADGTFAYGEALIHRPFDYDAAMERRRIEAFWRDDDERREIFHQAMRHAGLSMDC